jgi:hypothetical protein
MLVQLGCMLAQGYGIARPMPPEALAPWLAAWRLPAEVASCAPLERDDALLLKALVEQRAWHAAPGDAASPSGVQAFDAWLDRHSRKRERCTRQVGRALSCRDAFLAQAGDAGLAAAPEQASRAFGDALKELLHA